MEKTRPESSVTLHSIRKSSKSQTTAEKIIRQSALLFTEIFFIQTINRSEVEIFFKVLCHFQNSQITNELITNSYFFKYFTLFSRKIEPQTS
jgi:hypothetical protein